MLIESSFELPIDADRAWELLTDVERVAPCVPGVQLNGQDGDRYRGQMRVKVGPVTARYDCSLRFSELDPVARVAVLQAEGRELRGQGTASANVTTRIEPNGSTSQVALATDLAVTGRLAQFGRGMMEDVSNRLVAQFAERLSEELVAPDAHPHDDATEREAATRRDSVSAAETEGGRARGPEPEPLDLLAVTGAPPLRTLAIPLGALLLGFALGRASR